MKYIIIWNKERTEGYITNDADDADTAHYGFRNKMGTTAVGERMHEAYTEDGDEPDYPFIRDEVEL